MSNSVRPHRRQPTRLPRPWDSPGKNTGVGCHFLLQCMKVSAISALSNAIFIRLEPFQANFLLSCSARFVHFCQLNVKVKGEKASADKGILRCAVLYPTSCHLFKDCSPKTPGCLERLQCLLYSSPLTTKTKQTLGPQNPYRFCLVICSSSLKNCVF